MQHATQEVGCHDLVNYSAPRASFPMTVPFPVLFPVVNKKEYKTILLPVDFTQRKKKHGDRLINGLAR